VEGFLDGNEAGDATTEELLYKTAKNLQAQISHDNAKFDKRVRPLIKAMKAPNAFHQRSIERLSALVLGAGVALDQETEALNETHDRTVSNLKIFTRSCVCAFLFGMALILLNYFYF